MTTSATYELLEEIGRGPSAIVYRAHDMALKRDVAVKELLPANRSDPRALRRLLHGARFLAGMSHDNIVPVYGLDEKQGWIIMELMRGGLNAHLAEGPLDPGLARSVLRQALEGLQALHQQGKLHGDVKPSNLLINGEGRVKLSDATGTDSQDELQKPDDNGKYLAPELVNATLGAVGPASDLYSLGLTMLELLMGPGFDATFLGSGGADAQMAWLRLHGSLEPIPPAAKLAPRTPPDLARVIDRLLAKQVSARYATPAEALADLEQGELLPVELPTPAPAARKSAPAQVTALAGAPAPPPAPPRTAPPPAARMPSGTAGPKPWTRGWLNHKLSEPRVLYPLLGLMIVGTVTFFLWPEEETHGRVRIQSEPAGATITIDGKTAKQKTDASFLVALGKHHLRLELPGHEVKDTDFEVKADVPVLKLHEPLTKITVAAAPKKAQADPKVSPPARRVRTVRVATKPGGARIIIDGQPVGKSDDDLELPSGSHRLRIELADHEPLDEPFEVKLGEEPLVISRLLTPVVRPPEKALSNSIDMKLTLIPAGRFQMGATADETGVVDNEMPQHEVQLSSPFYMGTYEVTQEQYQKVMGANPAFFDRTRGGGPNHPVENVSWDDAVAFCKKLSNLPPEKEAGRVYQLPTEAEWEYACRAGTQSAFHCGDFLTTMEACFQGRAKDADGVKDSRPGTMPVGRFAPNHWGLYDMHGNVREWCRDWYDAQYYSASPKQDPPGPGSGTERIVRGGAWQSSERDCRSARRLKSATDLVNSGTGFRVVMKLTSSAGR